MPCVKKKPNSYADDLISEEEELNFVDYLKTLELKDFLGYKKTREYLENQHYFEYDYHPRDAILRLYDRMLCDAINYFPGVLRKDSESIEGDSLVHLIFNNIKLKTDISIFYDSPELAKGIDEYMDSTYSNSEYKEKSQSNSEVIEFSQNKKFDWNTKTYK